MSNDKPGDTNGTFKFRSIEEIENRAAEFARRASSVKEREPAEFIEQMESLLINKLDRYERTVTMSEGDLLKLISLARQRNLIQERLELARQVCGAAYQVVGAADGPVEMLDNLSDIVSGHQLRHDPCAGLPWVPEWEKPVNSVQDSSTVSSYKHIDYKSEPPYEMSVWVLSRLVERLRTIYQDFPECDGDSVEEDVLTGITFYIDRLESRPTSKLDAREITWLMESLATLISVTEALSTCSLKMARVDSLKLLQARYAYLKDKLSS